MGDRIRVKIAKTIPKTTNKSPKLKPKSPVELPGEELGRDANEALKNKPNTIIKSPTIIAGTNEAKNTFLIPSTKFSEPFFSTKTFSKKVGLRQLTKYANFSNTMKIKVKERNKNESKTTKNYSLTKTDSKIINFLFFTSIHESVGRPALDESSDKNFS
jgi:hypothetical protein